MQSDRRVSHVRRVMGPPGGRRGREISHRWDGLDPVSGVLRMSDGTNVLEVAWTGCGQYTATLNGEALPPVFCGKSTG